MVQDPFDITCLRSVATDPDARRIALSVAMIKVLALSMARQAPDLKEEALQIIDHARKLYAILPTRESLEMLVDGYSGGRPGLSRSTARSREAFVEALWRHFQDGQTASLHP